MRFMTGLDPCQLPISVSIIVSVGGVLFPDVPITPPVEEMFGTVRVEGDGQRIGFAVHGIPRPVRLPTISSSSRVGVLVVTHIDEGGGERDEEEVALPEFVVYCNTSLVGSAIARVIVTVVGVDVLRDVARRAVVHPYAILGSKPDAVIDIHQRVVTNGSDPGDDFADFHVWRYTILPIFPTLKFVDSADAKDDKSVIQYNEPLNRLSVLHIKVVE